MQYNISDYMEIIFLGTSSAVHSKDRNQVSVAVKAFGKVMLFDCGEGTQRQMLHTKVSPMKISKIRPHFRPSRTHTILRIAWKR